ncbi:DUF6113 family protein [Streptomyces rimosus]|uniref:DUF6113 family protein n=1 Tax=Streptomyces rimosus TaxID=1927 RepID=UPI00051846B1|nr:DUF6113 family protein [Streptomyces rimosus]
MSGAKKRTRATTGGKVPKTGTAAAAGGGRKAADGGTAGRAPGTGLAAPLSPGRVAAYVLLLVLGAVVAVAGGLVQAAWFPGGLLLALAGAGGLFYGGARALGRTGGVLAPGAGWLVTVILLSDSRPEGDFLFGAGPGTYVFLVGGIALAVICATGSQMRANGAQAARLGG